MTSSLIPDLFPNIFGDWHCVGSGKRMDDYNYPLCNYAGHGFHNPMWHWGYRHWVWITMGLFLFIVQFVRIIDLIDKKK